MSPTACVMDADTPFRVHCVRDNREHQQDTPARAATGTTPWFSRSADHHEGFDGLRFLLGHQPSRPVRQSDRVFLRVDMSRGRFERRVGP